MTHAARLRFTAQRGAAAIEFAIVSAVFFMLLLGAIEMGRLMWTWNAATEATRLGARMAVVCDINEPNIITRMQQRLPYLEPGNVSLTYLPSGCTDANCQDNGAEAKAKWNPSRLPMGSR